MGCSDLSFRSLAMTKPRLFRALFQEEHHCSGHYTAHSFSTHQLMENGEETSQVQVLVSSINTFVAYEIHFHKRENHASLMRHPWFTVHEFASADQRHPRLEAICVYLEEMLRQLKKIGYVPATSLVHVIQNKSIKRSTYITTVRSWLWPSL